MLSLDCCDFEGVIAVVEGETGSAVGCCNENT